VQFEQPLRAKRPVNSANSRSKAATSGTLWTHPLNMTRLGRISLPFVQNGLDDRYHAGFL